MKIKPRGIYRDRLKVILAKLLDTGYETTDLLLPLVAQFFSIYHNSYKNARRRITGDTYHLEINRRKEWEKDEYQRFKNSLQYLKREGFVTGRPNGNSFLWNLTGSGRSHLNEIKSRRAPYPKERADAVFIVSYDIPESCRRNRRWIREVLRFLNFSMVHRSVWVGSHKVPEDFLYDLKKRGIFSCVQIFEVGKRGTLSKIQ